MILNALACNVNDNYADIGKFRAGGLDRNDFRVFAGGLRVRIKGIVRRAVRPAGHNRMGMPVQNQINALRMLVQVHAPVSIRGGFRVHAQMRQRDHDVRAVFFAQFVNLRLCAGVKRFLFARRIGYEMDALNQARIHFRLCLRGLHAENADAHGIRVFIGAARIAVSARGGENPFAVLVHVRANDGKIPLFQITHQLFIAEIKLMVAQRRHVIACGVHHGNGVRAFGQTDRGIALAEVSRVHQKNLRALAFKILFQRRHIGVAHNFPVYVVGMQNDQFVLVLDHFRVFIKFASDRHVPIRHDKGKRGFRQTAFDNLQFRAVFHDPASDSAVGRVFHADRYAHTLDSVRVHAVLIERAAVFPIVVIAV